MGARLALEAALSTGRLGRMLRPARFPQAAYWSFFTGPRGGDNFQFGRYATWAAADAAIPARARSGWDNDDSARHYIDSTTQPSSYAVMFWLDQSLRAGTRVLDVGGGVGQMYYAYSERTPLPADVRWHVVDVAAAVALGRRQALERGAPGLEFTATIGEVPKADVLHSSGALQFMGDPLPGLLEGLEHLPARIIINKVVLTAEPTFWTLHNIGTGICTYAVFNERAFIAYFTERGYAIVDRWRVAEISMLIPFHPEGYVRYGSGFCFERSGATR